MAVKDFRSGDVLEGAVLLLRKFEVRNAKNNSTYADMTLADFMLIRWFSFIVLKYVW